MSAEEWGERIGALLVIGFFIWWTVRLARRGNRWWVGTALLTLLALGSAYRGMTYSDRDRAEFLRGCQREGPGFTEYCECAWDQLEEHGPPLPEVTRKDVLAAGRECADELPSSYVPAT